VVATKWSPIFRRAESIGSTIQQRLSCLAPFAIDLHQVHNFLGFSSIEDEMRAMADLVKDKKVRAVGVSNFNVARMRRAHAALAKRGLALASNQVKYSLLDRRVESNGTLAVAKELGVTIIAYSPLAQGILSGKFHRDPGLIRARSGPRKYFTPFRRRGLERSRPLVAALEEIAAAHGATPSQVALNWLVSAHGETVVVIPGATTVAQAEDNGRCLGFSLTATESRRLDELSRHFR
jgi:aryl-alcohol dehydrogenase-like predicted oxidoreductase